QPARVDEHDRAAPQPVVIVDAQSAMFETAEVDQLGPHERADFVSAGGANVSRAEGHGPAPQLERRPRERQRLQPADIPVFKYAKSHYQSSKFQGLMTNDY